MKQITIAGRVGKDAEVKDTKIGPVCKFSVAVDSRRGGEKTTWFNVSIFGKRGEALRQYLTKGTVVCIVGDLEARLYDHNGTTKLDLGVVASEVTLLGGGQRRESGGGDTGGYGGDDFGGGDFGGDGIPF